MKNKVQVLSLLIILAVFAISNAAGTNEENKKTADENKQTEEQIKYSAADLKEIADSEKAFCEFAEAIFTVPNKDGSLSKPGLLCGIKNIYGKSPVDYWIETSYKNIEEITEFTNSMRDQFGKEHESIDEEMMGLLEQITNMIGKLASKTHFKSESILVFFVNANGAARLLEISVSDTMRCDRDYGIKCRELVKSPDSLKANLQVVGQLMNKYNLCIENGVSRLDINNRDFEDIKKNF